MSHCFYVDVDIIVSFTVALNVVYIMLYAADNGAITVNVNIIIVVITVIFKGIAVPIIYSYYCFYFVYYFN